MTFAVLKWYAIVIGAGRGEKIVSGAGRNIFHRGEAGQPFCGAERGENILIGAGRGEKILTGAG